MKPLQVEDHLPRWGRGGIASFMDLFISPGFLGPRYVHEPLWGGNMF